MISIKHDQSSLGLTVVWLLLAFTPFLRITSAASLPPQQFLSNGISPTANEPGIGVEIEMGKLTILKTNGGEFTLEEKDKAKGTEMVTTGFPGAPKTHWRLTAEIGATTGLIPEAIVDGLQNKVGNKNTKAIGAEIYQFFLSWAPCRTNPNCAYNEVTVDGINNLGPLSVYWPKDVPVDFSDARYPFSLQVTTAMPLQAVLAILSDSANKNTARNPLASSGTINAQGFKILTKEDFKPFSKIKQEDINDEFLGFFSLLTSFCVLAHTSNKAEGVKRILNIMPRTDFLTQYKTFVEAKVSAQLGKNRILTDTSLYDIIEKVSKSKSTLATNKFQWNNEVTTVIADDWLDKNKDLQEGTLEVQKFLNYLQGYDKKTKQELPQKDLVKLMDRTLRYGQIGGLDERMEKLYQAESFVPIFEFRELDNQLGPDLEETLESYEDKVIKYHASVNVMKEEL